MRRLVYILISGIVFAIILTAMSIWVGITPAQGMLIYFSAHYLDKLMVRVFTRLINGEAHDAKTKN